jgi:hypothetical protein
MILIAAASNDDPVNEHDVPEIRENDMKHHPSSTPTYHHTQSCIIELSDRIVGA